MIEKVTLEIRAGEGGKDANLLVKEMAVIYEKAAKVEKFSYRILEEKMGYASVCLQRYKCKTIFF